MMSRSSVQPSNKDFAVYHYNMSIRALVHSQNESTTMLVCVLFMCLEFLRGNSDVAVQHCYHGVEIFNRAGRAYPWIQEHVFPILRRLSIFPLLFGSSALLFPRINGLDEPLPVLFDSINAARHGIENLLCRSIRFIRSASEYRFSTTDLSPAPRAMLIEREDLKRSLASWRETFHLSILSGTLVESNDASTIRPQMQHLVAKIWVSVVLDREEMAYDQHNSDFQTITDLAVSLGTPQWPASTSRPIFIYEMGFLPLLYFVASRCRHLNTRLLALSLMKKLSIPKENLWDVRTTYYLGKRIVELEHGIQFAPSSLEPLSMETLIPPTNKRMADAQVRDTVTFIWRRPNGDTIRREEVLPLPRPAIP
jgi:hypothetical protein